MNLGDDEDVQTIRLLALAVLIVGCLGSLASSVSEYVRFYYGLDGN